MSFHEFFTFNSFLTEMSHMVLLLQCKPKYLFKGNSIATLNLILKDVIFVTVLYGRFFVEQSS